MPFYIDKFKASPAVRAMHPAARAGYLYLLTCQWQSDDCSISSEPLDLAEMSELGDELWAQHGPRILKKFDAIEGGRLRNRECFSEWQEAKRVFEARRGAAEKVNRSRSPHGHRTVTATNSPGHRTVTDQKTDAAPTHVQGHTQGHIQGQGEERVRATPPPSPGTNGEFMLAGELGREIKLALRPGDIALVAQVIANESAEHGGPLEAKDFIRERALEARSRGEPVTVFWLQDRKFDKAVPLSERERRKQEFMQETEAEYGETPRA